MSKTIAIETKRELLDTDGLSADERELYELGRAQTERAYPPASLFFVGAAASAMRNGVRTILLGQNCEAANYRMTVCGEGTIAALVNTDEVDPKTIDALYSVGRIGVEGFEYPEGGLPPGSSCGACRTDINYLNPDMTVLSSSWVGKIARVAEAKRLLPFSIDPDGIVVDPKSLSSDNERVEGTLLASHELQDGKSGKGYNEAKAYEAAHERLHHLRWSGKNPQEVAVALLGNGEMVFGVEGENAPPSQPRYGAEIKALWNARRLGVDHRIKTLLRIRSGKSESEIPLACNGPVAQIMVEFAGKIPDGMPIVWGHEEGPLVKVSGVEQLLPDPFKFQDFVPKEVMARFK